MARRALLIGVSDYGEGFEALPGSLLYVRGMAEVLGDPEQGAFEVEPLLENPGLSEMTTGIEQFLRGAEREDLLLLYFSGHGDLGDSVAQERLHLCAKGTCKQGRRLVESSAMSADFLKRQMDLSKSQRIVVILDCCYSGAIADLLRKGEGAGIAFEELKAEGRVILASSSASESSYQAVDGFSLYTHYLLEGMAGAALPKDKRGDWIVARDLHGYAERRFEVEQQGGVAPRIIVVRDAGYELPLVRAPKADQKVEYQREVDRIFQELDEELGLEFDGMIADPLDRGSLETLCRKLGLDKDVALEVEWTVQSPYWARAKQRKEYQGYFELAVKEGKLPSKRQRRRLEEIRENLGLGKGDAEAIENRVFLRNTALRMLATPMAYPPGTLEDPGSEVEALIETMGVSAKAGDAGTELVRFEFETVRVDERGEVVEREERSAQQFVEDLGDGVTLEMVYIPGGEFLMGAVDGEEKSRGSERPRHLVQVPEFFMGKFAVTQAQYQAVVGKNPAQFQGEKRPVEQVSWNDAQTFCQKLSEKVGREYRLPSEAEWEYSCRAGTTTPFHFGKTISTDLANYCGQEREILGKTYPGKYSQGQLGSCREQTIEVGGLPPNIWGLYEMHGNVWEWCSDRWHSSYESAPMDGSAWFSGLATEEMYIRRGGSWFSSPIFSRSACRKRNEPDICFNCVGFRVVCCPEDLGFYSS